MYTHASWISVAPAAGDEAPMTRPVAAYILPGQARTGHSVRNHGEDDIAADWRRLRLKVTTDEGESETELDANRE